MSKQNFLRYDIAVDAKNRENLKFITTDLNSENNKLFSNKGRSLYFALDVLEHLSEPFHLIEKFETESNKGDSCNLCTKFCSVRMLLPGPKDLC